MGFSLDRTKPAELERRRLLDEIARLEILGAYLEAAKLEELDSDAFDVSLRAEPTTVWA